MPDPIVSTGRGGAGNIGRDDTPYVDAGIVREGTQGLSADEGEYSSGRGGAGNIGTGFEPAPPHHTKHEHQHHTTGHRTDETVIPEPSLKTMHPPEYHTGRGGQGNVHKDNEDDVHGSAIGGKIKQVLHLGKQGWKG